MNSVLTLLAQVQDSLPTPSIPAAAVPTETSLSLWEMILKGGIIMIPIAILSVITVFILVERLLVLIKAKNKDSNLLNTLRDMILKGDLQGARNYCRSNGSPVAIVLEKGISRIGRPVEEIENAMESAGKQEVYKLERGINVLSIVAGVAPMFGFIGTILGVIKIFYNISLADNISIGLIAGGLYEKMVTSAGGLIVGVLAFICFHWLNALLEKRINAMELAVLNFLDILNEPGK
ncbi:MAG: MotA/TolQ/ExbB proton channel family protein [Bacteroidia bacterium]|nr:MotA/TolQ/ExbB proton channel family protein [Bacteroidia bacterium]